MPTSPPEAAANVVVRGSALLPYGQTIHAGFHVLAADEPASLGGQDSGPAPTELLMAALGACTAITIRMVAARKGWALSDVIVALRHERVAGAGSAGGSRFLRDITLLGALEGDQREYLLGIAEKCPVSRTLKAGAEIISRLQGTE